VTVILILFHKYAICKDFGLGFSQDLVGSRGSEYEVGVVETDGVDKVFSSTELVLWMDHDSIEVEPLSMVVPHIEDNTTKPREIPRVGFYQTPPPPPL
jgi:hypothetical protein